MHFAVYENIKKMTIFEKQELLVSEEKTVSKEGGNLGQFSRPFFFFNLGSHRKNKICLGFKSAKLTVLREKGLGFVNSHFVGPKWSLYAILIRFI